MTRSERPRHLTVGQTASLLGVTRKTVHEWIRTDKVSYFRMPGGSFRIPRDRLFEALEGNYDFASELAELDDDAAEATADVRASRSTAND